MTTQKIENQNRWNIVLVAIILLTAIESLCFAEPSDTGSGPGRFVALPFAESGGIVTNSEIVTRYGIPFQQGDLKLVRQGSAQVNVGCPVKRIFVLGMSEKANLFCWASPLDHSVRFFIGDKLAEIRLNYADGTAEVFPLVLGEGVWWGKPFFTFREPFPTDIRLRNAMASALRLYPPAPVADGNYVAVINPRPVPLQSITFANTTDKQGTLLVAGITVEPATTNAVAKGIELSPGPIPPAFGKFMEEKPLRLLGKGERQAQRRLNDLRLALYTSDASLNVRVPLKIPPNYRGPKVSFKGGVYADILENAFYANVQDMSDKVDRKGMYHTSTLGAPSWGGYNGFGTFRKNCGTYYGSSWCRDLGRSLQELTELGYTNQAAHCADYCLRMSELWEQDPLLRIQGTIMPPHWGRVANKPDVNACFENDGHGLITLFLYKLWQRLPDRDQWLRARWPVVKALGDWILWQFAHPKISGAANGVLYTTSECSAGKGYSVYADAVCMDALDALAQMADSIGQTNSARQWRTRAEKMQQAIGAQYAASSQKYGRQWTLRFAGWPNSSTVLGPLIFLADYQGFAPQDDNPAWRLLSEGSYRRLIDTFQPFGFYGQAMGYGQGFVSQAALLLDRMQDATRILDWTAKEIYDPQSGSFIVPEGVQIDLTGHFWYHTGDLGNGVQEAENVKSLRLVIGVDDTHPDRIQFYPRMPYDWNEIAVKQYPVLADQSGKTELTRLDYRLVRSGREMKLNIAADRNLGTVAMRLGPFKKPPGPSSVIVNGKRPAEVTAEHSGDSWWAKFTMPVGPEPPRLSVASSRCGFGK
ncbi:MAG TPA: hypothetical protein VMF08_09450 [Candidatus Sulfotelmatobacter sp.]|nr:hypothetical protein [Candidatus Sulfotelmatobacter sp.]